MIFFSITDQKEIKRQTTLPHCDITFRQTCFSGQTKQPELKSADVASAGSLHSALWIIDTDTCGDPGSRHTPMNTANTHIHTDTPSQHAAG